MDRIEQTIRRKDEEQQKKDRFKYNFLFACAVALSLVAIYWLVSLFMIIASPSLKATFFDVIPLVVSVILTVVCFLKKDDMLLEYDYIVEDDRFIIAKIKNLNTRKEVINIPASSFKRIDAFNQENFKSLDGKKYNCSLNEDSEKYVLIYEQGERCAVVFEPNDELLKMIKKELNK